MFFYFQIIAEGDNKTHADISNITVNLINLNDNDPQFGNTSYMFEIKEISTPGTSVGQVSVRYFW